MTPSEAKESLREHIALVDRNGAQLTRGEREIALLIADHDRILAAISRPASSDLALLATVLREGRMTLSREELDAVESIVGGSV